MSAFAPSLVGRPTVGERRQVTAMAYDIVGSTELMLRSDVEDYRALQSAVHVEVEAAVGRFGGWLAPPQGDGGLAFFGVPDTTETSAEDAVHAALALLSRLDDIRARQPDLPELRLGIATGWSVVTPVGTPGGAPLYEVIGLAPTHAARIQSEAEPSSALANALTFELTRGLFDYRPVEPRRLKGFPDQVRLFRPLACRPAASRFAALRRRAAPLVGREEELARCSQVTAEVVAGRGRVLFLSGEAGIGKSRLAAEIGKLFSGEPDSDLVLQCHPRDYLRPLRPLADALRAWLDRHHAGAAGEDAIRDALCRLGLGEHDATILAALQSGQQGDTFNVLSPQGYSASHRDEAVAAAVALVVALAPERPAFVLVEDFHWADSLTKAAVASLAGRIANRPILLIVTSRDAAPAEIADIVEAIALERLSEAEVADLVGAVLDRAAPDALTRFIHAKSDGNALFAEELAFRMRDLAGSADQPLDLLEASDPSVSSLRDLLGARLAALGESRAVAQLASAFGRDIPERLLALLVARRLPEIAPTLAALVERLTEERIFEPSPSAGAAALRFRHVLVQDVAYESLLKAHRREIHQTIAALGRDDPELGFDDGSIAWHLAAAGEALDAARFAIRAAEACYGRSAVEEARALLDLARAQLEATDGASREAEDVRLRYLMARGPVNAALHGRGAEETRTVYEEGVAICQRRGERERADLFPLYWGWWFTSNDLVALQERAKVLVSAVGEAGDDEVRLQSLHCAWATHFDGGHHTYCLACVAEGLALYDVERARHSTALYGGHDARVCGLGERALSLWFTGDAAGSEESIRAAVDWARRREHLDSLLHALTYKIGLFRYRNDFAGVVAVANDLEALAQAPLSPGTIAKARLFRGWARVMAGDAAAGGDEFDDGYARQRSVGTIENVSIYNAMRADVAAASGRHDEALALLDAAIDGADGSGQTFWLAELHRARAALRRRTGADEASAVEDLRAAVTVATEQGALALRRRAERDLAAAGATVLSV